MTANNHRAASGNVAADPRSALNVPDGVTLRHNAVVSPVGTVPRGTRGTLRNYAATTATVDFGEPYGWCNVALLLLDHSAADVTVAARRDPVREQLEMRARDAEQRAMAAADGIIRCLHGGLGWGADQLRRYRADFDRARADLDLAIEVLRTLDAMDDELRGAP